MIPSPVKLENVIRTKRNPIHYGVLYLTIAANCFLCVPHCVGQVTSDIKQMIANFPITSFEELVENIDTQEYQRLLKNDSSENWRIVAVMNKPNAILIVNKQSPDNSIEFCRYKTTTEKWLFGVQQVNAQIQQTDAWLYTPRIKAWDKYPVPKWKINEFISEQVVLPVALDFSADPYLNVEFGQVITFKINSFLFLRELENSFSSSGSASGNNFIKYGYVLGPSLVLEKKQDEDFETLMIVSAEIQEETDGGPGVTEFNCPHGVSVTTSSELPAQTPFGYKAANLLDENNKTAWSEGVKGSGIGEWIEFTLIDLFRIGESYQVLNGYTKDKNTWMNNSRVKKLKCFVNGKPVAYIWLQDDMRYQSFTISPLWFKNALNLEKGDTIRFVIEEVYKGLKYDDTLLSQFIPTGNCG